jgi:hypothetical protein
MANVAEFVHQTRQPSSTATVDATEYVWYSYRSQYPRGMIPDYEVTDRIRTELLPVMPNLQRVTIPRGETSHSGIRQYAGIRYILFAGRWRAESGVVRL